MKRHSLLPAAAFLFFFHIALGQSPDNRLITGDFKELTATQFITKLESQSGLHVYFDSSQTDSLRITLSVRQQSLTKVLVLAFSPYGFYILSDQWDRVFISKKPFFILPAPSLGGDSLLQQINRHLADHDEQEINSGSVQKAGLENKLYEIGDKISPKGQSRVSIAGYVIDAKTGEPISGASVYLEKTGTGVVTDQYGYFSISAAKGGYTLIIQSIGMKDTRRQLQVYGDGKLTIELHGEIMTLKRVTIAAQKLSNVKSNEMGVQKIDIKTIKQVPVAFGEGDLLKVMLTLPGVKSVGESSTGLNVRGGSADQNLILFNDATIYNPSHFFGLFSAFNPEMIKDVELYKSSIPARYGGRLSSVLDISSREGNKKNITGSAGIGLLTSRLELEGPLLKDKTSFIIGGRTTYADWLLNALPEQYKNSKASFYDLNLELSHEFDKKNNIYITGYLSRDGFNLNSDTIYHYGNQSISLKWKHIFSNKLSALFITGHDRYAYDNSSSENPVTAYKLSFDVNQTNAKAGFTYFPVSEHRIEFGLNNIYYRLHPGTYEPVGTKSLVATDKIAPQQAMETALYLSDQYTLKIGRAS